MEANFLTLLILKLKLFKRVQLSILAAVDYIHSFSIYNSEGSGALKCWNITMLLNPEWVKKITKTVVLKCTLSVLKCIICFSLRMDQSGLLWTAKISYGTLLAFSYEERQLESDITPKYQKQDHSVCQWIKKNHTGLQGDRKVSFVVLAATTTKKWLAPKKYIHLHQATDNGL